MQLNNKFLFDRDFDLEKARQQQVQEEQKRVAEEPPAPVFDEAALHQAQKEAYEQGYTAAMAQADQSQQQLLVGIMDRVGHKLNMLLEQEDGRTGQTRVIALRAAMHIVKTFWPKLQNALGQKDLEDFIANTMAENNEESRIVLRVNDAQLDQIAAQLPRLKELQGYQGKVITLADDAVMPGDCKIEWADGGAEKLSRHVMEQVEQLMERVLASSQQGYAQTAPLHNDSQDQTEDTHD